MRTPRNLQFLPLCATADPTRLIKLSCFAADAGVWRGTIICLIGEAGHQKQVGDFDGLTARVDENRPPALWLKCHLGVSHGDDRLIGHVDSERSEWARGQRDFELLSGHGAI